MPDNYSNSANELKKFQKLWWDQGILHPKANWAQVEGVSLEKYEYHCDIFNIHELCEWSNGIVTIIELASRPHEICINSINRVLLHQCDTVAFTDTEIYGLGSTHKHNFH
ncbi:8527_t:CDS:2 [Diversispora eburnea]|uniref:8527_t:CDS:1 n=1 Tax=Diversispora eburnea TaxID=1213867 RepID=A0A9N8V6Z8_9GLOM|nr:8527_t:CDS:2 [Diversispora eburnea]